MKVVINVRYGGFSLSEAAIDMLLWNVLLKITELGVVNSNET